MKVEGDGININVINGLKIIIIIGVLAIIYLTMAPADGKETSLFDNMVFIILAAFGAVAIVRLLISGHRRNKK